MKQPILAREPVLEGGSYLRVEGGLHYIRGNSSPYFSLTCSYRDGGGAAHELILKHFPQFADLAALHLSDVDGSPMYAADNGFFHMGGVDTFGKHNPPNWKFAADHFRITEPEVRQLARDLFGVHYSETAGFLSKGARADALARLGEWVDTQRARWRAEADACIRKHGLRVYGDGFERIAAIEGRDAANLAHTIADMLKAGMSISAIESHLGV